MNRGAWTGLPLALSLGTLLSLGASHQALAGEARLRLEMIVPAVQRLEVDPAVLSAPALTSTDLAQGYVDLDQVITITLYSNTPWELSIRRPEDPSGDTGPRSVALEWSRGGRAYLPLTEHWTVLAADSQPVHGSRIELKLRVPLSWTGIEPGTYEPQVEYRLARAGG